MHLFKLLSILLEIFEEIVILQLLLVRIFVDKARFEVVVVKLEKESLQARDVRRNLWSLSINQSCTILCGIWITFLRVRRQSTFVSI